MADGHAAIRRGRKYPQVLKGARAIFLRDGFEGASVDSIAQEAGVSKATLYSYFPDKRQLFIEVAKAECRLQADAAVEVLDFSAPPAVVLPEVAQRITGFISSEFGARIYRMAVAESERFPLLARAYYESGPLLVRERLSGYLRQAVSRGELTIEDVEFAADQFFELCRAGIHLPVVLGLRDHATPDHIRQTVAGAVRVFIRAYAPGPAAAS